MYGLYGLSQCCDCYHGKENVVKRIWSAGVAAGFNAPISGVFFAVESVLQREPRDSETEARNSSGLTVAMVLLASVVAAIVSRAGLGDNPAFKVPPYQLQSLWEIPLVMLLGSACGLVSVGFSYCSEVTLSILLFCTGMLFSISLNA